MTLNYVGGTNNGNYFIANVLGADIGAPQVPFSAGDEILKFGDKATKDAVNELISQLSMCNSATDTALAAMLLTMRRRSMAVDVPNGPVMVQIRHKKSNRIENYQLEWIYTPEMILNPDMINKQNMMYSTIYTHGYTANIVTSGLGTRSTRNQPWINRNFSIPLWDQIRPFKKYENPHLLGARKSYIPPLGNILWQVNSNAHFHAYIYLNENNQMIGYIRIPHFGTSVFTFTGSLAYRVNDQPIENLGVTPDILYHISEKDLQNNYPDYKNAINHAVNTIIK